MDTGTITDSVKELGVGGLVAVLVIREVLGFLRDKRRSDSDEKLKEVEEDVDELKVAMAKVTTIMDNQTRILEKLVDRVDDLWMGMAFAPIPRKPQPAAIIPAPADK